MTTPTDDAGAVINTVVTAAVALLETLNNELHNSPTDTVPGDVVRGAAQRLQDELDKVNAGNTPVDPTPVPDPSTPDPTLPTDPSTPDFSAQN